jgi:hypothetical protein
MVAARSLSAGVELTYPPDNVASVRYINGAPGTVRAFGVWPTLDRLGEGEGF